MSDLEYLSLSKPERFLHRFLMFFVNIGVGIGKFFKHLPSILMKMLKKIGSIFTNLYEAFHYGDWKTKFSFFIFGFGNILRGQVGRGILYLVYEVVFIVYMAMFGWGYLSKFATLGTVQTHEDDYGYLVVGDNSFEILLYSIISILLILLLVYVWYKSIREAYLSEKFTQINKRLATFGDDLKDLGNKNFHISLLSLPMLGLIVFTVVPIIFMIFVAFTNYDNGHMAPRYLFTWVGTDNFANILFGAQMGDADTNKFSYTFQNVLLWTLVWAIFATFSNFIVGLLVAIMINKKGIHLKKLWRTILVTTIAVPQFVSLLLMSQMLTKDGAYNVLFSIFGWLNLKENPILWLDSADLAKVTVLLVNLWIGVPYTVLSTTGILMNVPEDLYEAAKIDGANPVKMFSNITMPYILFVMGPTLISTFVGNINNFNVIFLLTGGGPYKDTNMSFTAGSTSLLITWLYKLTLNDNKYPQASVIGILIFVIVSVFSLIFYSRSSSLKNEEDFQ